MLPGVHCIFLIIKQGISCSPIRALFIFLTILLNSHGRQAGRQAGRRTGKAGIVHYFAISFTLSARFFPFFFFFFFYPAFFLSQFYIRPDIEIKQTSSGGRSLFSLAFLVAFCSLLALVNTVDPHWEKERCVCGLVW
jgi:hypothetical protein